MDTTRSLGGDAGERQGCHNKDDESRFRIRIAVALPKRKVNRKFETVAVNGNRYERLMERDDPPSWQRSFGLSRTYRSLPKRNR